MTDLITRIQAHATEQDGCWIWHGAMQSNSTVPMIRYGNGTMSVRRAILVDRGSMMTNLQATYTCGNPLCVNPEHVEAVRRSTLQKRIAARRTEAEEILRGRNIAMAIRASSPRIKRSLEFAREIRAAEGTQREIAQRYGSTQSEVSEIKRGLKWKEYVRCPLTGALS